METTRRLSLTLLLVAPLITAQDLHIPDLSLSSVSGEHLPDGTRAPRPSEEEYDDQEEIGTSSTMDSVTSTSMDSVTSTTVDSVTSTTMDSVTSTQHAEDEQKKHVRNRRDISSSEDMEVAEQVVFRPIFRHRQILADRKLDQEEAVRSQSLEPATSSGQLYNPYQYNYNYYPLGAYRSQRSVDSHPDYYLQFKPTST